MVERYYEIFSVELRSLEYIRDYLWYAEGAGSPEEFEELWIELHPDKEFDPKDKKYIHWFRPTFSHTAPYKPQVKIPFRADLVSQILGGRKLCTSRSKEYGTEGYVFSLTQSEQTNREGEKK